MAVHIFISLVLLHLKTQQEFLTAQATLKRNEFVCRAKRKRIAKKARALVFRPVGEPNRLHAKKLSRLPGLPYLLSPPRVLSPSRVISPTSCKRLI